jgi:uncharacterized membrane-anchored protein YitT (DUF2179 family)
MNKNWPNLRDYGLIVISSLLQAFSLQVFFVPANLASGGVSGIAQLINHFTGWPIGVLIFLGNIPLFALGWRFLGGRQFALRTAFAIVTYSLFADLILRTPLFAPNGVATHLINDLQGDIFLNTFYGAIVSGTGYGLVYRARGTSGGSDILARILNHYRSMPVTQSYLMVDTLVILGAGFVFGWKSALYSMIALYVSGLVAESVLEGGGTVRAAMIVTREPEAVANRVLEELERGLTVLEGTGAYTGVDRPVLYCVVSRAEIATLKAIVSEVDPHAFMVIGSAHEALGEGFRPLRAK